MNKKISTIEAIVIFTMITINTILLDVPKTLINSTGSGAVSNFIFVGILCLIFLFIILKLFKHFPTCDILDVSNYLGGKTLKLIVGILFIFLILLASTISIAKFVTLLKTVYFKESPILFILLFFNIAILICNLLGFGAIKKSICFYFPISLLAMFIIFKSKLNGFSLLKITPFFGYNYTTTFLNGSSNIFFFTNIILIFFILPFLENDSKFKKITFYSFFISWILGLLTIVTLLSAYPLEYSGNDINSIYILTKRIEISDFLQRCDGLFVLVWLFAFLSYISLNLYLITYIIKKLFNIENEKMLAYTFSPIILGISFSLFNSNFLKFESTNVLKFTFIITIYLISFFILIFSMIKKQNL